MSISASASETHAGKIIDFIIAGLSVKICSSRSMLEGTAGSAGPRSESGMDELTQRQLPVSSQFSASVASVIKPFTGKQNFHAYIRKS